MLYLLSIINELNFLIIRFVQRMKNGAKITLNYCILYSNLYEMKRVILLLILVVAGKTFYGQDPNFSQFFVSPLTLNPALTGKFEGDLRIAGNYRNQWPSINNAYKTATVSADAAVMKNRLGAIDRWGVGVLALTDKTGNGILNNNYLALSTAYHKGIDEDGYHQIGVGFQGVFAQSKLDGTRLQLGDQLTTDGTWENPSNDPLSNRVLIKNYFDVSAGILYNGATNDWNNFYAGVSMYHINKPKESFSDMLFYLNPRYTLQAGGSFLITPSTYLHLSALHSNQAKSVNTVFGGAVAFNLTNDTYHPTSLYLGSWLRWKDGIIPYVGLELNEFRFGMSYDINTSSLKPASNMRGGVELSLIYIKQRADRSGRNIRCPKF